MIYSWLRSLHIGSSRKWMIFSLFASLSKLYSRFDLPRVLLEICDIGRVEGKYKYGQCCCCLYARLWGKTVQVNGELFTEVWKSEQNECCAIGRGTLGYFGISS